MGKSLFRAMGNWLAVKPLWPDATGPTLPENLWVGLLVAVGALHRSSLAVRVFCLVAVDAQPGGCCGIVKGGLQSGGDRRSRRVRVAIGASLLRRFQWLLPPGSMMADDTLAGNFQVRGVIELHSSYRRALKDEGRLRSGLRERAAAEHDGNGQSAKRYPCFADFHGASQPGDERSAVHRDTFSILGRRDPPICDARCRAV